MSSLFTKLNLTHQERRLVVFVGLFLFLVLNLWLVWPHFGDLGRYQQRLRDLRAKAHSYEVEIQKEPTYKRERDKLREAGQFVPEQDKARELLRTTQRQAATSGVRLVSANPGRGGSSVYTNEFFDEETLLVRFESGQKELIDFLYNLGAHGSLIRVRTMTLAPDSQATRYKLAGDITLVESFARTPPPKTAAPAAAPTTAPATAPPAPGSSPPSPGATSTSIPAPPANGAPPAPTEATAPTPVNPATQLRRPGTPNPSRMPAFPGQPKTRSSPNAPPVPGPQRIQPTNSGSGVVIPKRKPLLPNKSS